MNTPYLICQILTVHEQSLKTYSKLDRAVFIDASDLEFTVDVAGKGQRRKKEVVFGGAHNKIDQP